jgi:hypothetical protein
MFNSDEKRNSRNHHGGGRPDPFNTARHSSTSESTKGKTMKSRLLIRALCVGAALLVPAGGLTVLGIGTAGAVTIKTVATSTAKLAGVGSFTMKTIACGTISKTTNATHTCAVVTKQALITGGGGGHGLIKITIIIKITGGAIKGVKAKTASILIKSTTSGTKGCKITTIPSITYAGSSTTWSIVTKSLTGVTVTDTSSVGPCNTATSIANSINTGKLNSKITFSNI